MARVAAVLAGDYGEELREKLTRWITVFFRYRQLKERGLDVKLVSPRPGLQVVRINHEPAMMWQSLSDTVARRVKVSALFLVTIAAGWD